MLHENDIKVVRKIFEQHHYVMTTAEILGMGSTTASIAAMIATMVNLFK